MKLFDESSNQHIEFNIPEKHKKIAVNCSGGADSSILLLLTVDYLIKNNRDDVELNVLTCSNDYKHRWNGRKAADIINYVIDKTKFKNFNFHHNYYRDRQDVKYFHQVEYELFTSGKIDLIIGGITANPLSEEALVEDKHGKIVNLKKDALEARNGTERRVWKTYEMATWYDPFTNVDKRFVAFLYKKLNAEDMFDLTRSCESIPVEQTKYQKDFEEVHCGKCWWCLERKWAFGRF